MIFIVFSLIIFGLFSIFNLLKIEFITMIEIQENLKKLQKKCFFFHVPMQENWKNHVNSFYISHSYVNCDFFRLESVRAS